MSATSLDFIRKDKIGIIKHSISKTCLICYQFHAIQSVLKVPGEFFHTKTTKMVRTNVCPERVVFEFN